MAQSSSTVLASSCSARLLDHRRLADADGALDRDVVKGHQAWVSTWLPGPHRRGVGALLPELGHGEAEGRVPQRRGRSRKEARGRTVARAAAGAGSRGPAPRAARRRRGGCPCRSAAARSFSARTRPIDSSVSRHALGGAPPARELRLPGHDRVQEPALGHIHPPARSARSSCAPSSGTLGPRAGAPPPRALLAGRRGWSRGRGRHPASIAPSLSTPGPRRARRGYDPEIRRDKGTPDTYLSSSELR